MAYLTLYLSVFSYCFIFDIFFGSLTCKSLTLTFSLFLLLQTVFIGSGRWFQISCANHVTFSLFLLLQCYWKTVKVLSMCWTSTIFQSFLIASPIRVRYGYIYCYRLSSLSVFSYCFSSIRSVSDLLIPGLGTLSVFSYCFSASIDFPTAFDSAPVVIFQSFLIASYYHEGIEYYWRFSGVVDLSVFSYCFWRLL